MDPKKALFKRQIELMGWSKSEAARRLHKTPSAINHLVNPDHPNKPTQATLALLNLIIDRERSNPTKAHDCELKQAATKANSSAKRLSTREGKIIENLKRLPAKQQEIVYALIKALLRDTGRKDGKTEQ
jgi:hypothetical protein